MIDTTHHAFVGDDRPDHNDVATGGEHDDGGEEDGPEDLLPQWHDEDVALQLGVQLERSVRGSVAEQGDIVTTTTTTTTADNIDALVRPRCRDGAGCCRQKHCGHGRHGGHCRRVIEHIVCVHVCTRCTVCVRACGPVVFGPEGLSESMSFASIVSSH